MFTTESLPKFVEALYRGAADELGSPSVTVPMMISTVHSQLDRIQGLCGGMMHEPITEMAEIGYLFADLKQVYGIPDPEMCDMDRTSQTFKHAARHFAKRCLKPLG